MSIAPQSYARLRCTSDGPAVRASPAGCNWFVLPGYVGLSGTEDLPPICPEHTVRALIQVFRSGQGLRVSVGFRGFCPFPWAPGRLSCPPCPFFPHFSAFFLTFPCLFLIFLFCSSFFPLFPPFFSLFKVSGPRRSRILFEGASF